MKTILVALLIMVSMSSCMKELEYYGLKDIVRSARVTNPDKSLDIAVEGVRQERGFTVITKRGQAYGNYWNCDYLYSPHDTVQTSNYYLTNSPLSPDDENYADNITGSLIIQATRNVAQVDSIGYIGDGTFTVTEAYGEYAAYKGAFGELHYSEDRTEQYPFFKITFSGIVP